MQMKTIQKSSEENRPAAPVSEQIALEKERHLLEWLRNQSSAAIAFSGGVDSAYLAWAAHEALKDRALAVTACAHSFPGKELSEARELAKRIGISHETFVFDEFQVPGFAQNPPDRCYHCKTAILVRMKEIAGEHGIFCVAEGSNADDDQDYRPGVRAVREQQVASPLKEAGLTKAEIRFLSRRAGLPTWNKQSAACLASRFAYGEWITPERLRMAELAENYLRSRGFDGQLRVRVHGNLARLEVEQKQLKALLEPEMRCEVTEKLREIGFSYVTLDLQGYRMGSMNEVLGK